LSGTGQYDVAVAKYQQALQLASDSPDATRAEIHLHLGQALAKLGRGEEASRELKLVYQLNPQLKNRLK
jgi:tetratricopeptide (TPR) repeat protein